MPQEMLSPCRRSKRNGHEIDTEGTGVITKQQAAAYMAVQRDQSSQLADTGVQTAFSIRQQYQSLSHHPALRRCL